MKKIAGILVSLGIAITSYSAVANELVFNGKLTQGSLIRGQLPAGSQITLNGETLKTNSQGKFVFGFGRDADLSHSLKWTLPDGTTHSRQIKLEAREYVTQRIDGLDQKMVTPPESVLKRIRQDAANVYKARAGKSDSDALFTGFIWPAEGPVTGVYGSQRILNGKPGRPHYGLDVGSPTGTPVVAPVNGTVTLADDLYYSGNTVVLDHGMGVFSTFLHLDSMGVQVGDTVKQGEQIGTIGSTGRSTGAHLDWRINLNDKRLDPQLLVPPRD
ncbi:M23 family metallopeptidase [Salinimonas chungwhensis]|uniref:M23 family metallopeptidase n=1 Tax=Salinimonas chungwhensis TaxID=265425 RepID=UPI000364827A|nr:M23 family metallopeptidase [Salinimonas chungwhensis]